MVIFGHQGEGLNITPVVRTKSQILRNHSINGLDSLFKGAGVVRYPNRYRMIGLTLQDHLDRGIVSGFTGGLIIADHPHPRSVIVQA